MENTSPQEKNKPTYRLAYSGGKDSTAMLVRMLELGMRIDVIEISDNDLEFPEVKDYVDKIEKYIGRKIHRVRSDRSFKDVFYKKILKGDKKGQIYGFPDPRFRGCYIEGQLKLRPLEKRRKKGDIVYIGFNADEKSRIMINRRVIYKYPLIEWGWGDEKIMEYLKEKGLYHKEIYDYLDRTGCWFCPKQSKKGLKFLWKHHPDKWEKLKELEIDSPHGFHPDFKLVELEERFMDEENPKPFKII